MKKLLTILLVSLGVAAQAQTKIKINDFVMRRGFVSDTATYCRIDCTALPIDLQTSQHRPTFALTLHNALGTDNGSAGRNLWRHGRTPV